MESGRPAGPGSSPAFTLYDVAREAGVSTATVSRVVHGQDRVRLSTRRPSPISTPPGSPSAMAT